MNILDKEKITERALRLTRIAIQDGDVSRLAIERMARRVAESLLTEEEEKLVDIPKIVNDLDNVFNR